ncbi:MAG: hypothetical protein H0V27_13365 [Pyrinomonadaceae bacterium]|nr:hypothetical protein [Pyrinomonadaceae bacterium]
MSSTLLGKRDGTRWRTDQRVWIIYAAAVCCTTILVPLFLSPYEYSTVQLVLASVLACLCLYPTARYFAHPQHDQPAFAVLCISYATQFAVPVFTRDNVIDVVNGVVYLNEQDVVAALVLAILGVGALQFSYYWFKSSKFSGTIPVVKLPLNDKRAFVYCIVMTSLLFGVSGLQSLLPSEWAFLLEPLLAFVGLLENQLLVIIGVLGWLVYSGRGGLAHKTLLYGLVALSVFRGASSAFLEQAILPVVVLFLMRWLCTRRLPIKSMALAAVAILFLSPVKGNFRAEVWNPSQSIGVGRVERTFLWFSQASEYWMETLSGERSLVESTAGAASRTDLIHQLAYIYMTTPSVVPYEYGGTYSYFVVAWVPRFVWPDKPTAGLANRNFAVNYGITTPEVAESTTFGMSLIGEGFINFGIVGVVLVMAVQGAALSLLEHIFGSYKSGAGGQAVFLAFYVFLFNGVGSSAEILFGNIFQNLTLSCILLWWARANPSAVRSAVTGSLRLSANR